jgi:monoamine oxidase
MTPIEIAIIGGGPGGLMTAYLLETRVPFPCQITLFEASGRLGGKIWTPRFGSAPVHYEAGAAELYDYSQLGPDPLRELIVGFGLETRPMGGEAVIVRDRILRSPDDLVQAFGRDAERALRRFTKRASSSISPAEYYESDWKADNQDPLLNLSFAALLDDVSDENVRRYIEVAVHSDLATEPEKTSAMYGLQNYLMNLPQYMRLYTIDGGLERLPAELAKRIHADVRLNEPVIAVERTDTEDYRLFSRQGGAVLSADFDFVVVALPNNWIPAIDWRGPGLTQAMRRHVAHYAYPAHYLRVSVLFERPFWREQIADSYFMVDAFGGTCVYDESARSGGSHGILGWLLAGDAALTMSNLDDAALIARVLESLPGPLQHGRQLFLEGRVHRWLGAVNGLPGGRPLHEPDARHIPEPNHHPWLFVVGDYLFDSTLNGVLDSADTVAELIVDEVEDFAASAVTGSAAVSESDRPAPHSTILPAAAAAVSRDKPAALAQLERAE